ncbi:VOC family protein [Streptomyces cyaneofuscatus]|uniref:VOC family protein n=1 Tax=Streptomyces TaxID=1883 RepID=UPI001929C09D|nr:MULTISPECIES: VOC family protein [unclassified Streptomyces]CAD5957784.1 Glyoxalase_6 domain-containing protein [Streptomyces sp. KY70]CAD5981515.1 Glyoxalase_6 domain-containing protein [Streptomyces sp. KY75]
MTRTLSWKLVIDSADPHAQAGFWAEALGYLIEDNSALVEQLLAAGAVPEAITTHAHGHRAWLDLAAARHPDDPHDETSGTGLGRRLLFQRVPEPKTVKNRLHIDVHTAPGERDAQAERLVALGARILRAVDEPGGSWLVLSDPEGNEFCVN